MPKKSKYKEKIIELRLRGYNYNQIKKELGCSKSLISYYCNSKSKETIRKRYYKYHLKVKINKKINTFMRKGKPPYNIITTSKFRTLICNKIVTFSRNNKDKSRMFTTQELLDYLGPNPKCYLTGDPIDFENTRSWHLDHIVPLSKGGTGDLNNVGITTRQANQFKADNTLDELDVLCIKYLNKRGYTINKNNNEVNGV